MVAAVLIAGLAAHYRVLGADADYTPAAGGAAVTKRVIFTEDGSSVLDGMVQSLGPTLRVMASSMTNGVKRGDTFVLGAATWRAREDGLPHNGGSEYLVPLHTVRP